MPDRDAAGIPDGRNDLDRMGWEPLPYGCVGLARKRDIDANRRAWSWLILIPWAHNDAKPWIDGTTMMRASGLAPHEERDEIVRRMRETLDKRYGETVGQRAAQSMIDRLQDD